MTSKFEIKNCTIFHSNKMSSFIVLTVNFCAGETVINSIPAKRYVICNSKNTDAVSKAV